jgi:predicted Zn-dependent protease
MLAARRECDRVKTRLFMRGICLLLTGSLIAATPAAAQESTNVIRDPEIETTIRTFATPIWLAAGLNPDAIHIYIVNDPTLNSFVAGGQNIFLNTGMLMRSETPNQMIGVIAHETGHIAGGHLARAEEAMRNATIEGIVGMLIGAAAAAASRGGSAGGGAMAAGAEVGERSWMMFSTVQEASADHAALTFLDRAHMSSRGLLQFFEILQQQEFLSAAYQSPFLRDHPLTDQRVEYVREHVETSPWSNAVDPPAWIEMHKIMKAKLDAFLSSPAAALAQYKADDKSVPARYARSIAYYRIPDLPHALELINGLVKEFPNNPYYPEMKGQMLFENGRIADAVEPYETAVRLYPANAWMKVELAQVLLETNDPKHVPRAETLLREAVRFEDREPLAWRLLAIAYGKENNMGMMALSLAEQAMADGDYTMARQQAARAAQLLPAGADRQQAQDLAAEARRSHD